MVLWLDDWLANSRPSLQSYDTMGHTNFQDIRVGTLVNLEFDILGKYIARLSQLQA